MVNPNVCPICGAVPEDHYVQIVCTKCGLAGPFTNGGKNDDHADYKDARIAVENWNMMTDWIAVGRSED